MAKKKKSRQTKKDSPSKTGALATKVPTARISNEAIMVSSNHAVFRKAFWSLLVLISSLLLYASTSIGIPGDEPIDATYGQKSLAFYKSLGKDTSFADLHVYGQRFGLQKYYGAGFEMPAALVSSAFPGANEYRIRHLMVALAGALTLLFIGLTAKHLAGWSAAIVALILSSASAPFMGQMLFNSKDVPFALGFAIAIYFSLRLVKELPTYKLSDALGTVIGIAFATSIRIGGILFIAYLAVLLILKFGFDASFRKALSDLSSKSILKLGGMIGMVLGLGLIIGLLFYPNFFGAPAAHFIQALTVASDFPVRIMMLFEGKMLYSTNIPNYYLVKSLIISLPLFVLFAALSILLFSRKVISLVGPARFFFLLFTIIFPITYLSIANAAVYNGWRHILFFYPSLMVLASVAITAYLIPEVKKSVPAWIYSVILIILIGKVIIWQVQYYPFQYTYYNEIVGGFSKAFDEFDNDYQQIGVSTGLDWLLNDREFQDRAAKKKLVIASNNANALKYYYDTTALNVSFFATGVKDLRNLDWDYAVMSTIFVPPKVQKLMYPPIDAIHTISVEDRGLAYVIRRDDRNNFLGLESLKKGDVNRALPHLRRAFEYNNKDFSSWLNLAHAYSATQNGGEVINYTKPYLELFPNDWSANQLMGVGHYLQKDYVNSERYLLKALRLNKTNPKIYENLLILYRAGGKDEQVKQIEKQLANL